MTAPLEPSSAEKPAKPIHILLVCLLVVAAMFLGSIGLSMLYISQSSAGPHAPRSDDAP
jgi:hypothetical protein